MNANVRNFFVCSVLLALDLISKWLVVYYEPAMRFMFLGIRYTLNKGIALSLLDSFGVSQQLALIFAISVVLLFYILHAAFKIYQNNDVQGELLVIAGGLGNLVSRFWCGGVVDFIEIHFFGFQSSVFNIADVLIAIGLTQIVIRIFNDESA